MKELDEEEIIHHMNDVGTRLEGLSRLHERTQTIERLVDKLHALSNQELQTVSQTILGLVESMLKARLQLSSEKPRQTRVSSELILQKPQDRISVMAKTR